MPDYYTLFKDDIPREPPKYLLVAGYIGQIALYILIIVYCILSQSLFSAIALLFMLVSLAFTIGTPYYIIKKQ
jgi:hypothetical protein